MSRAWFWSATGFAAAGLALAAAEPDILLIGYGHPATPAAVHLLTLGVLLGGYYPLQGLVWETLYGPQRLADRLAVPLWALHVGGTLTMAWGLYTGDARITYLGGHYLVPIGVVVSWVQGGIRLARRAPGRPRALASHLPALGLAVVMSLGVMLMLDRAGGGYGFYGPRAIVIHALAAVFLFILPARRVDFAESASAAPQAAWSILSGLGLLALAMADRGLAGGIPLGLGLLGGVALWVGLPGSGEGCAPAPALLRRLPWAGLGLLLLLGALWELRGVGTEGASSLAAVTGAYFLLGVAVPEWLERLARMPSGSAGRAVPGHFAPAPAGCGGETMAAWAISGLQWSGTAVVLAGQLAASPGAIQAGVALWLTALGALGWSRLRR